jgi:hypothetical protein
MAGNASRVRELRGLASVWNDLGLRVLEMAGWEDRGRSSVITFDCLGCHHTAAPTDLDWLLRDGRADVPGPLCNVALHAKAPAGWKGELVLIASGRANHFGTASISSSRGLGVEATGPPFPNYDAYVLLAAGYCIYFNRDPAQVIVPAGGAVHTAVRRVTAHKYVAQPEGRKVNPSFDFETFLRRVDAARDQEPRGWWEMSIPQPELDRIGQEATQALGSTAGQEAIRRAVSAELSEALKSLAAGQVFVQQEGAPQVYLMLSGQLLHIPDQAALYAMGGANAGSKILRYPKDSPVWELPISGQPPGGGT